MIRVGIADDHAVVRAGLRRFLATQPGLQVAGEAGDGDAAVVLACGGAVDVLLLDLDMPGLHGVDALAMIRAQRPALPVLVFSGFAAADYAAALQQQGARGFLDKTGDPADIVAAIHAAVGGQDWFVAAAAVNDDAPPLHAALSARELQVLLQLAQGRSVGQIADRLGVSTRTIGSWRRHVLNHLRLDTNSDLTYYALKNGLIR